MARHNLRLVIAVLGASVFLALHRVIPHPPNFTPIIAGAVFLPWLFGNVWWAWIIPMLGLLLGDIYWGFHPYMLYTYGSLALICWISLRWQNLPVLAVCSSLVFFVITNFGVWLSGYYGYTLQGLWQCYVMAIPFYTNTLISTVVYTGGFYIIYKTLAGFSPMRQTP